MAKYILFIENFFAPLSLVEHTKDRKIIYAEANNMFEFDVCSSVIYVCSIRRRCDFSLYDIFAIALVSLARRVLTNAKRMPL